MNLILDYDANVARLRNNRKHFGRPSFSVWVDEQGRLHAEGGEDLDHSTRCQRSLNDWYAIEQRLKWNNWVYIGSIIVLALALDKL